MIVKVQQSILTTEENKQVLIYDKTRKYIWQGDITPEVQELLGTKPKIYFNADIINNKFVLKNKVKPQNW